MSWSSGSFRVEDLLLFPDDNSNETQEISQIVEQNVVKEMVGLDLGQSSNKKQKKLRSAVWKNFEKYTDANGKEWAKCNICKKPFNGSSKMGTTHLKNHFNSCSKNKKNEGGGSASGDKPAEDSVMDQQLNHLDKSNEGGGSASGDIPAENSVMDQQLNHLDKSNEGAGSASGDEPAEDSVMDQQLNHWDKSNEGAGSGSGDKPVENSMMDQQLNRLDMGKMPIKQSSEFEPLLKSIEAVDIINAYNEEKEKLLIYLLKEKIDAARQCYIEMESANNVLKAQIMELTDHLRSLNSVLQIWGEVCGLNVEIPDVKPWKLPFPMQPILASADMFKF